MNLAEESSSIDWPGLPRIGYIVVAFDRFKKAELSHQLPICQKAEKHRGSRALANKSTDLTYCTQNALHYIYTCIQK